MQHQPELAHEHTLHRLVAGSAFLFALCALPIAQYAFFHKSVPAGSGNESGQVAGVSTERTAQSVGAPLSCSEQRIKLADLDELARQKGIALDREIAEKVQPYTDALALLNPAASSYSSEKQAIDSIIASEKAPIENRRVQWQSGIAKQRADIAGQTCVAE